MKKLLIYFLLIISNASLLYSMEDNTQIQSMETDKESYFQKLPRELIEIIFMFTVQHEDDIGKLVKNLLLISQTNKEWHVIIENGSFWNTVLKDFFQNVVLNHAIISKQIQKSEYLLNKIKSFTKKTLEENDSDPGKYEHVDKKRKIDHPEIINQNSFKIIEQIDLLLQSILPEIQFNLKIKRSIGENKLEYTQKFISEAKQIKNAKLWYYGILQQLIYMFSELEVNKSDWEKLIQDFIVYSAKTFGIDIPQAKDGSTALIIAALKSQLNIAKYLIEHGANVNKQETHGATALMIALYKGHSEIAKLLIERNANINKQDKDGVTALMWCAQKNSLDIAKLLIEHDASSINMQNKMGRTALIVCAEKDHLEIAKLLIERNANINKQDKDGVTALMWCACIGHLDIAKLLVEHNVGINIQNKKGITALMYCADNGHLDIANLLLDYAASIDLQDKNGATALMHAAFIGQSDIIRLLIKHNADMTIKNNNGETALSILATKFKELKENKSTKK